MNYSYEFRMFLNSKVSEVLVTYGFFTIGNKMHGRCPFCGDSKKSSTKMRGWYYLDNSSYYCFNCGTSISAVKMLHALTGQTYDDLRKEFSKYFLDNSSNGLNAKKIFMTNCFQDNQTDELDCLNTQIVKDNWKKPLSKSAEEYLKKRLVLEAPFYDSSMFWSCTTKQNDREYILIPWKIRGVESYYQLNDFHKYNKNIKYVFPKNLKKTVFGLDNVDASWPYIIVFEGVYDSLFVKNGIAVGTKAITDFQISIITNRFPKHTLVFAFDNDTAGLTANIKFIKHPMKLKFLMWYNYDTPEKDINDYIISKRNVSIFSDSDTLEQMMVSKLSMKMFLLKKGIINDLRRQSK